MDTDRYELLNHYTRTVLDLAQQARLPEGWRINIDASSFLVLSKRDEGHWAALRMFYVLEAPLWRWDHGSMDAPNGLRSTTWEALQDAIDWYTTEGIKAAHNELGGRGKG